MALEIAVVSVALPHSSDTTTVSATSSGFGTPQAALIFVGGAYELDTINSQPSGMFGVWDGTRTHSQAWNIVTGAATSNASRRHTDSGLSLVGPTEATDLGNYTVSSNANGIDIAWGSGTTTIGRYATVILIKGAVSVRADTAYSATSTTSHDITDVGFKPTFVFLTGGSNNNTAAAHTFQSFGVAHNNSSDTVTQACVSFSVVDNVATKANNSGIFDTLISRGNLSDEAFVDTEWSIGSFDTSGFTLTRNASGAINITYLAIELDDDDDAYVGLIDVPSSTGSQSVTGLSFEPVAIGLMSVGTTATGDSNSPPFQLSCGVTDGTTEACHLYGANEGATMDARRYFTTSKLLQIRDDDFSQTLEAECDLTSFNSDGWTLNWTDAASTTRKALVWAMGNQTASGAPTITALSAISITATSAQPQITYA